MRTGVGWVAVAAVLAGCAAPPPTSPVESSETTAPSHPIAVDPARIDRARDHLPPDYEVVGLDPHATPISLWGVGQDWTADPAPCGAPVAGDTTRGWSASGPGGIVYTGVTPLGAGPPEVAEPPCEQWQVVGRHTVGRVAVVPAPEIDDAHTLGLSADLTTVVEGGTETRAHAHTFTAATGGYRVFVTTITDPGSPNPPLAPRFGADLLIHTVAALRG